MTQTKNKNRNHGGARAGSGRKPVLQKGKLSPTYLDEPSRKIFSALGEGNLSKGAQRAAKIVDRIGVAGCFLLLENKDLAIDVPQEAEI
jgi:hypothetical protein